ncbi:hypothetical protein [Sinorhizobium psoraleae]|uniref:hypothetical protein n=1 Tax=Sinorhizobium psoraleae TaxID=520838 RepID=UPI001AED4C73|nr:hypothetical protein [Sinorhizobium psoraleae]
MIVEKIQKEVADSLIAKDNTGVEAQSLRRRRTDLPPKPCFPGMAGLRKPEYFLIALDGWPRNQYTPPHRSPCEAGWFGTSRSGVRLKQGSKRTLKTKMLHARRAR